MQVRKCCCVAPAGVGLKVGAFLLHTVQCTIHSTYRKSGNTKSVPSMMVLLSPRNLG